MVESLIKEYLSYITQDHHKRRDMSFWIEKVWGYGDMLGYRVVHDGYCHEYFSEYFSTYAQAEADLIRVLKEWIKLEKEHENE